MNDFLRGYLAPAFPVPLFRAGFSMKYEKHDLLRYAFAISPVLVELSDWSDSPFVVSVSPRGTFLDLDFGFFRISADLSVRFLVETISLNSRDFLRLVSINRLRGTGTRCKGLLVTRSPLFGTRDSLLRRISLFLFGLTEPSEFSLDEALFITYRLGG